MRELSIDWGASFIATAILGEKGLHNNMLVTEIQSAASG